MLTWRADLARSGGLAVTEPAAVRTFKGTFVTSLRSYKRMFGRPQKTVDVPDVRDYRDCAFEEVRRLQFKQFLVKLFPGAVVTLTWRMLLCTASAPCCVGHTSHKTRRTVQC